MYAHLGVTIVLGIAPRQLGVHRTIEWEPTELVRLLVSQSVVVVVCCLCPPWGGGVFGARGVCLLALSCGSL